MKSKEKMRNNEPFFPGIFVCLSFHHTLGTAKVAKRFIPKVKSQLDQWHTTLHLRQGPFYIATPPDPTLINTQRCPGPSACWECSSHNVPFVHLTVGSNLVVFLSANFWILPSPSVPTVSDDGRTPTEDPFSAKALSDLQEARRGGICSPGHASLCISQLVMKIDKLIKELLYS